MISDGSKGHRSVLHQQERAMFLGLMLALLACVPAVAVALLSGSVLLLSDLFEYARAIFTNLVAWSILRSIRTGKTIGYDYGTDKLQTLGGMLGSITYIAALLFISGLAMSRLAQPIVLDETFSKIGAIFQFAEFVVSLWLWLRNRKLAGLEYSPVMEMQWRANRADALASLAVFLGLTLTLMLHAYPWSVYIDPLLAIVFLIYTGVSFLPGLSAGLNELLDKTLQEDLQLRIDRRLAENFDGYAGFHGVRSRKAGGRIFIEIALSFPLTSSVGEVLSTTEHLRQGIESDIPSSEVRILLMPGDDLGA
jgi:ferrous-iron efflux pump FieF